MIYILAGIAKSGKSLIAKEVMRRYQMEVIATDRIMMMLHYGNKDLKIDVTRSDQSVSRMLEPYIAGLITSLSSQQRDVLIEGVHMQPEFAKQLQDKYPNKLKIIFLGYKDVEPNIKAQELLDHAQLIDNPWYVDYDKDAYTKLINYLINESHRLYKDCMTYKQQYIEVYSVSDQMDEIIHVLLNKKA